MANGLLIEGAQVTKLNMRLASGSEDSSCEVSFYDPSFVKYLDLASRYQLPIELAGRLFTFDGQPSSFDASTLEVTLTGNSPAWQLNLVPRYRVFQNKTARLVLRQLGIEVEDSPALDTRVNMVQTGLTDYQFAQRLCASLGLRLRGNPETGQVEAKPDKLEPVLLVTGVWSLSYVNLTTNDPDVLVEQFGFRASDNQDSAKDEPTSTPEVASADQPEQVEPSEKFVRIDPRTGQRLLARDAETPRTEVAKAQAKARALELDLGLICTASTAFLAQPGDTIVFDLTDASGQSSQVTGIVESADYDFYPDHLKVTISLKTSEK